MSRERTERHSLPEVMKEFFFSPSSLHLAETFALFMVVTMPSSLVRVNKGRGWQIVAAMLSNSHIQIYLFICVCVCANRMVMFTLHTCHHILYVFQSKWCKYLLISLCIIFSLPCLFKQWTAGSRPPVAYICLASLHNPLVFHVNSNSAVLEHRNIECGWTTNSPSPITECHSSFCINNVWIQWWINHHIQAERCC